MTPPRYATDYTPEQLERSRQTLLQVMGALGDVADDVALVGGLVPTLLVDQAEAAARDEAHVGSVDVDLGLHLVVLDDDRYEALADRLRRSDFEPDVNEEGNRTRQRWRHASGGEPGPDPVVIDFLIDAGPADAPGRQFGLTRDLAAIATKGLALAFQDSMWRTVAGTALDGDEVEREVRVCGPAAFVVLKAFAMRGRKKEKDAYDLAYVVRNWDRGPEAVAERWAAIADHPAAAEALDIVRYDFAQERRTGPRRASRFLFQRVVPTYAAEVAGDLQRFLIAVDRSAS